LPAGVTGDAQTTDEFEMTEEWPWLAMIALGAFHGLNPAMGWLFAVALGLHRQSRAVVLWAIPAIAVGHAVSVLLVAFAFVSLSIVIKLKWAYMAAGLLLIGCAGFHWLYGHKHRVRFGMTTGLAGLAVWSFLMATAHGAGLMILPALMPLCLGETSATGTTTASVGAITLAAVLVHGAAMLAVTGGIALLVYDWIGLSVLRSAWINFDALWMVALVVTGVVLIVMA
jgi:hypothetical protein